MLGDLLLLSGNDIPFQGARTAIHQPTIKEIAYIGEEAFYIGCELLKFSKESLTEEDKNHLEDKTDFDVLMSIMVDKQNSATQRNRIGAMMVLTLMFPKCEIYLMPRGIKLKNVETEEESYLTNENFSEFKNILCSIFCLSHGAAKTEEYNPSGELAKKIADKLKKGNQQRAELKKDKQTKISILSRYVSILAVGENKDINSLLNYTVYQLFDEFERYKLKLASDTKEKMLLAGAKDVKEVDDWMKDIHP